MQLVLEIVGHDLLCSQFLNLAQLKLHLIGEQGRVDGKDSLILK